MQIEPIQLASSPRHHLEWPPTLKKTAFIFAAFVLFFTVCHRVLETPTWSYNGARLMPSLAVSRGVNYYVLLPPGGPLYSSLYGPLVSLIYLPAILFHTPNSAVLAGSLITTLLCFSTVGLLHFAPAGGSRGAMDGCAFLAAGFLMCYLEPLKYSCFNIHADGPGMAFGGLACVALSSSLAGRWRAALPLSAVLAVLSVFCKQPFLPVPIALLVWLWIVAGRARALRYLLWLVVAGGAATAAAILAAGPANLYHCLIWVPAHHPWYDQSRIVSALQAMRGFIRLSMPVPVLLLACAIYLLAGRRLGSPELRALAARPWAPLLMAGIALLPASIMARAKVGGDVNSLSFALFFLTCATTVMLADAWRNAPDQPARRMAAAALLATILPLAISEAPLVFDLRASVRRLAQAPQQVAFEYLQRHPGEAYFPWFPLSHYYAEHQFRHYSYGLLDRWLAGEQLTTQEFRAYVPRDPRVIAFSADGTAQALGFDIMKYFPEYHYSVTDPELSGWVVYGRRD